MLDKHWLKDLYPGYFAMTMATGIISVALHLQNFHFLANVFFVLAIITWIIMTILYTWRLVKFPKTVFDNLLNPKVTFIFFTFVAATDISGVLLHQHGYGLLALICWVMAFVYW
ncbi:MAG TPA: hypothetical protein ENJ41_04880, partial [Oceanospirillales bacterium]|nr:hypothetical protein [Oceanospirillales bacterium]